MTKTVLEHHAARFQAVYERSLLCIYVHDFEGRFLDANDAALALLGFSREELFEVSFSTLLDEEQLPLAKVTARELFETGSQKELTQFRLRRKDGTFVWVETEASVLYDGDRPFAIQGLARDITDHLDDPE